MTTQTIHKKFLHLLRELARKAGVPDNQPISEDGQVLVFEPNLEVSVSFSERRGLILLGCPLCELEGEQSASIYRTLLEANLFWLETGGATLSIDGITNRVFLAEQRALDLVDIEILEQWLDEFVTNADKWRRIITIPTPHIFEQKFSKQLA